MIYCSRKCYHVRISINVSGESCVQYLKFGCHTFVSFSRHDGLGCGCTRIYNTVPGGLPPRRVLGLTQSYR